MIGCHQAGPGENCVPGDVAMSEAMRSLVPTVDIFGMPVDLGWLAIPAMFFLLFTLS